MSWIIYDVDTLDVKHKCYTKVNARRILNEIWSKRDGWKYNYKIAKADLQKLDEWKVWTILQCKS